MILGQSGQGILRASTNRCWALTRLLPLPILLNLFSADIITHPRVITVLYTDVPLQSHLLHFKRWYSDWKLKINDTKSENIFISRRKFFGSTAGGLPGNHRFNKLGGGVPAIRAGLGVSKFKIPIRSIRSVYPTVFNNWKDETQLRAFKTVVRS